MNAIHYHETKTVYWHRELPPLAAELLAEHTADATSGRVPGTLAHRDELWDLCYEELMTNAESRLVEEVARLGGHYAHVSGESISPKRDDAAGETWLHGRFTYMLYRQPAAIAIDLVSPGDAPLIPASLTPTVPREVAFSNRLLAGAATGDRS